MSEKLPRWLKKARRKREIYMHHLNTLLSISARERLIAELAYDYAEMERNRAHSKEILHRIYLPKCVPVEVEDGK